MSSGTAMGRSDGNCAECVSPPARILTVKAALGPDDAQAGVALLTVGLGTVVAFS
jgi:hypothetical protein